jgi:Protein of unknown function (DUF3489)
MAGVRRTKQWHDLRSHLKTWAPEANAWCAGRDAGQCNAKEAMMSKRKTASTEAPATSAKPRKQTASKPKTKLAQLEAMLRRPDGVTIEQISKSLDWQAHSVRGAMSGALKKKQGLSITSEKTDTGRRLYRIAA